MVDEFLDKLKEKKNVFALVGGLVVLLGLGAVSYTHLETYVSREFFEKFEEKAYFKTFPSTLKCPLDCLSLSRRQ